MTDDEESKPPKPPHGKECGLGWTPLQALGLTEFKLGSSWDHVPRQVVPNPQKILHPWSMAFRYVILTHMIMGNTPQTNTNISFM